MMSTFIDGSYLNGICDKVGLSYIERPLSDKTKIMRAALKAFINLAIALAAGLLLAGLGFPYTIAAIASVALGVCTFAYAMDENPVKASVQTVATSAREGFNLFTQNFLRK